MVSLAVVEPLVYGVTIWLLKLLMYPYSAIYPSLPPVGVDGAYASRGLSSSRRCRWGLWLQGSFFLQVLVEPEAQVGH